MEKISEYVSISELVSNNKDLFCEHFKGCAYWHYSYEHFDLVTTEKNLAYLRDIVYLSRMGSTKALLPRVVACYKKEMDDLWAV
jgi:hypothetical protein